MYVTALRNSGLPCDLQYVPPSQTNKQKRSRNPIYDNPPFSLNVKTNIGAAFLKLVDKHFNAEHPLHKFFNRSKIKVSYCTMPNMMKQINKHNAKILRNKTDETDVRMCNCRSGRICPVDGQYLQKSVIYQADIKCQNTVKTYYGLTELTFKEQYNKHMSSFRDPEQQHSTSLSTYLSKS